MSRTFTLVDSLALGDLHVFLGRALRVDDGSVRLIAGSGVLAVYVSVLATAGGLFGIGNEGISVYALDYRRGMPPSVVMFGMSSSDWGDVTQEAGIRFRHNSGAC